MVVAHRGLAQEGLAHLIESNKVFKVVATYDFADNLSDPDRIPDADVAVIYLDGSAAGASIGEIRQAIPGIRVVVISDDKELEAQTQALKLGAVGIVKAQQSAKLLFEAIRQTFRGETWLNQVLLSKILEGGKHTAEKRLNGSKLIGIDALTPREVEVVKMIGKGLKSKIIAEQLFISEATVRHHLSSIYGKLCVDDRLNLVIFAYQKGLIQLSDIEVEV